MKVYGVPTAASIRETSLKPQREAKKQQRGRTLVSSGPGPATHTGKAQRLHTLNQTDS